eukprot:2380008-Pyramimonas_sp.AAC.1
MALEGSRVPSDEAERAHPTPNATRFAAISGALSGPARRQPGGPQVAQKGTACPFPHPPPP